MRKTFKYTIAVFGVVVSICLVGIWTSYFYLETTYFEYTSPKLTEEIKLVILADLHGHEFGEGNSKLISEVKEQDPDLILILGDMLNADSEDNHVAVDVTTGLLKVAPVYYALGNHEITYIEQNGEDLLLNLERAGVKVLELESQDIEVKNQKIRIGGIYDYAFAIADTATTVSGNMEPGVYDFLTEFEETDALKIMMSHRPDSFIFGDAPKIWDIDLVISAHNHGGQVILPFVGGLYGGDQGWFPEYVYGLHSFEKYDMLITRGLGSNPKLLPRFNNRPEVMVLTLKPET